MNDNGTKPEETVQYFRLGKWVCNECGATRDDLPDEQSIMMHYALEHDDVEPDRPPEQVRDAVDSAKDLL